MSATLIEAKASIDSSINADVSIKSNVGVDVGIGRAVEINGTTNYERLSNKPRIEGVELVGNLLSSQLNLATKAELGDKVDKVSGKGLSSEDFTEQEKAKLSTVESNAAPNVIEVVKKNGTSLTVSEKAVNITVPTKVSELNNDEGFITNTDTSRKTASIPMGHVDDTSTNTAFTATVDGISELRNGVCVWLKNGVVSSASGFTIDINGLGAKPAYSSLSEATRGTTVFNIEYTLLLIYNSERVEGGCWDIVYGIDNNANSLAYMVRYNSSTLPAIAKGYKYRIWFTSADGKHYVPANSTTSASPTTSKNPINIPIDPFGEIIYYTYNGTTDVGTNLTPTNIWTQYAFSLGYSFNETGGTLALTPYEPIYVKCAPQSDGSAVLQGYTQDKPTTDDGFIYIYLGLMYSSTNIELSQHHPVYWHDGVCLRLWTGTRS